MPRKGLVIYTVRCRSWKRRCAKSGTRLGASANFGAVIVGQAAPKCSSKATYDEDIPGEEEKLEGTGGIRVWRRTAESIVTPKFNVRPAREAKWASACANFFVVISVPAGPHEGGPYVLAERPRWSEVSR